MINSELVDSSVKLAPPAIVTGGHFLGISWDQWLVLATLVYTLLQIGDWFWQKYKEIRRGDKHKSSD